jgi:hypothetical protein
MKGYVWTEDSHYTPEEEADGAYWERNMLALQYAKRVNEMLSLIFAAMHAPVPPQCLCGWYNDTDNNWDGWHRVISLDGGEITFHIPDDFEVGTLPKIKANWDGHTTKQKWNRIANQNGVHIQWRK